MKSPLFEEVDYVHFDERFDSDIIFECNWSEAIVCKQELRIEFPLRLRRERYHHSNETLHRHRDFFALYIVRAGQGTRIFNGYSRSMARGDVFLMAPGNTHCFQKTNELTLDASYFQASLWPTREWNSLCNLPDLAAFLRPDSEGLKSRNNSDYFGHLPPELHTRIETSFVQMRRLLNKNQLPPHLAARGQFFALLFQLAEWRLATTFSTTTARGSKIAEILTFCDRNFHRPVCNEQLARLMHYSEGHFRSVFTREVGMSPGAYIAHLRLQRAQELMHDFSLPFTQVAHLSGFGDADQMGRAFKKALGTSPANFRKKLRTSGEAVR